MGATARATPRQLSHRPRRSTRVPHPRRDQRRIRRRRSARSRLRRSRGVRGTLLRDGTHRRAAHPSSRARKLGGRARVARQSARRAHRCARRHPRRRLAIARPRRHGPRRQLPDAAAHTLAYPARLVSPPPPRRISDWLEARRPADQPSTLCHGDYKLDNLLFALDAPPRLLAVVDWEMAAIGDPLVDLAWALVFHPGPEGTIPLGMAKEP